MPEEAAAPAFGHHAPAAPLRWLRGLTRLGIARGGIGRAIRRAWERSPHHPIDLEIRGVRYRLDIRDNPTDARLLVSPVVYDRVELEHLAAANAPSDGPRVFVDAGANIGYYSLAMAQRGFDRVIAIEPNPPTLARLRFNIESNPWRDRITVVPCCIGQGGDVDFHTAGSLGNAGVRDAGSSDPGASIRVPSHPLLDIVREAGATRIDALKIDVEGYEDRCLPPFFADAPRSLWPAVMVMEYIGAEEWSFDLIAHLLSLGYREQRKTRSNVVLRLASD